LREETGGKTEEVGRIHKSCHLSQYNTLSMKIEIGVRYASFVNHKNNVNTGEVAES
jgi:hypothetical protein